VRWFERRAQVAALVKHWHETHQDRWQPQCELVQIEIKAAVMQLAFEAIGRDAKAPRPAPFGKPRFGRMMRGLVSQLRVKRFGHLQQFDAQEWQKQIDTIAGEFGWSWIEGREHQLPTAKAATAA
jgi:hypothetical protein